MKTPEKQKTKDLETALRGMLKTAPTLALYLGDKAKGLKNADVSEALSDARHEKLVPLAEVVPGFRILFCWEAIDFALRKLTYSRSNKDRHGHTRWATSGVDCRGDKIRVFPLPPVNPRLNRAGN